MTQEDALLGDALEDGLYTADGEDLWPLAPAHSVKDVIPKFRMRDIVKVRNKLRGVHDEAWSKELVTPAMLEDDILPVVCSVLPKIDKTILHETLSLHLMNRAVDENLWDYLSVRLAGNQPHLKKVPLLPTTKLPHNQWALLETAVAEFYLTKKGHQGAMFTYRVRTGLSAGVYFKQFTPLNFLVVYGDMLGLGKARWRRSPRLYVGMSLLGFLEPTDNIHRLCFFKFEAGSGCKRVNKFFVKGRTEPCIQGRNDYCWNCPQGLHEVGEKHCKYATHKEAWEERECPRGHTGWYDRHWGTGTSCRRCREAKFF